MLKAYIGTFALAFFTLSSGFACNYKILDMDTDTFKSKIILGYPITDDEILNSLRFLQNEDSVNEKYKQSNSFSKLYERFTSKIDNEEFDDFAQKCKHLYEERKDSLGKIALTILFDNLSEKYFRDYLRFERYKKESASRFAYRPQPSADNNEFCQCHSFIIADRFPPE